MKHFIILHSYQITKEYTNSDSYKHIVFEKIDESCLKKDKHQFVDVKGNEETKFVVFDYKDLEEIPILKTLFFEKNPQFSEQFIKVREETFKNGKIGLLLRGGFYPQIEHTDDRILLYTINHDSKQLLTDVLKKKQKSIIPYNFTNKKIKSVETTKAKQNVNEKIFENSDLLFEFSEWLDDEDAIKLLYRTKKSIREESKKYKYELKKTIDYQLIKAMEKGLYPELYSIIKNFKITKINNYNGRFDDLRGIKELTLSNKFADYVPDEEEKQEQKLPEGLTYLNIGFSYYDEIPELPESLTHLIIGTMYDMNITLNEGLTHLTLGYQNKNIVSIDDIDYMDEDDEQTNIIVPTTLENLVCGFSFEGDIPILPNLTRLDLTRSEKFQKSLPELPALTHLSLHDNYQKELPYFPNLKHLKLGFFYNTPITSIPLNLEYLHLGDFYEHPLPALPKTLKYLYLSHNFNSPIEFPENLTELQLGRSFTQSITLPQRLNTLTIGSLLYNKYGQYLPDTITNLTIECYKEDIQTFYFPKNLTHLTLSFQFNQSIDDINFPSTLTHLYLGYMFNKKIKQFPRTLTHLKFGEQFNKPILHLPPNLIELEFGTDFNQKIDKIQFPTTLKILKFGEQFNQKIDNLPEGLEYLSFGPQIDIYEYLTDDLYFNFEIFDDFYYTEFNQPIKRLPSSLSYLSFGFKSKFNKSLNGILPKGLSHLTLGIKYGQPMNKIPTNIIDFNVYRYNDGLHKFYLNKNYKYESEGILINEVLTGLS